MNGFKRREGLKNRVKENTTARVPLPSEESKTATESSPLEQNVVNNATSKVQIRRKREKIEEEKEHDRLTQKEKVFAYVPENSTTAVKMDRKTVLGVPEDTPSKKETRNTDLEEKFQLDSAGNLVLVKTGVDLQGQLPEDDMADKVENDTSGFMFLRGDSDEIEDTQDDTSDGADTVEEQPVTIGEEPAPATEAVDLEDDLMNEQEDDSGRSKKENDELLLALTECQQGYFTSGSKYTNAKIVFEDADSEKAAQHLPNGEILLGNARVYGKDGMPKKWNKIFEVPMHCGEEIELDLGVHFEIPDGYGVELYAREELSTKFGLEVISKLYFDPKLAALPITVRLRACKNTSYLAKFQKVFVAKVVRLR